MAAENTMQAVVFDAPYKISLEKRPIPQIQEPTDIVIKVAFTALCGSELHVYRGLEGDSGSGFIMGHEFTGHVHAVGSAVSTVKIGDLVVSPFTISCGACFYCTRGYSSRCTSSRLFGSAKLDGGQAEYVRVPLADSTVVKVPDGIREQSLVLMADIFPTGYFAAANGFKGLDQEEIRDSVVVLLGCGPVALCALVNLVDFGPRKILAVDSIQSRLDLAEKLGAEPHDFATGRDKLDARVKELTEGRGADVAVEVVGLSAALRLGFDLLRPFGTISSVGVHNGEIPWTGNEAYGKNVRIQMGRCPVRSIFPAALEKLKQKQDLLDFMFHDVRPLSGAVAAYEAFDKGQTQKVVFDPQR